MWIHLYEQANPDTPATSESKSLRLLTAYENGGVILRQYLGKDISVESSGWDVIWKAKLHVDTSKLCL